MGKWTAETRAAMDDMLTAQIALVAKHVREDHGVECDDDIYVIRVRLRRLCRKRHVYISHVLGSRAAGLPRWATA